MHRIHNTKTTFEAFDAELVPSTLKDVNMTRARFDDVNLERAVFNNVNLSSAEYADVNFTAAHFRECDFTGATLDGVLIEDLLTAYRSLRGPIDTPE